MIPNRITIHCSASENFVENPIEKIRKFHTDPPPAGRGWKDIGYHMVIQPSGEVENGRSLNEQGAGVEGENDGNIHICLVGTDSFTIQQFHALRYKLDSIFLTFNIKKWNLYLHNQFPSAWKQMKCCPGMNASKLLYWYWFDDEKAIKEYL